MALAAAATGAKAWGDSSVADVAANDSPQLSIAAPVQMRAVLDPTSGEVSIKSSEVQNNGTSDVLMESAAFDGAKGVSGTWTVGVAGASVELAADGAAGGLGDAEVSRGTSAPLAISTTFSGLEAGKMVGKSLGSLTLTFKEKIETFAVFSADDGSLTFYKRGGKPTAGDMFCGKAATEVYEGFEEETYKCIGYDDGDSLVIDYAPESTWYRGIIDTPWFGVKDQVKTVLVADGGIRPKATNHWFYRMINLETADLAKLDASEATNAHMMFCLCVSLRALEAPRFSGNLLRMSDLISFCWNLDSLDLSASDLSNVSTFFHFANNAKGLRHVKMADSGSSPSQIDGAFTGCINLEAVEGIERWRTQNVETFDSVFSNCFSLKALDLSSWSAAGAASANHTFRNCSALSRITLGPDWRWVGGEGYLPAPAAERIDGADGKWYDAATGVGYGPEVVPAGVAAEYVAADPKTAFAVFSADDGSLDFYKRMSAPAAGDAFEGKTATDVYTGFDKEKYDIQTTSDTGANDWTCESLPWWNRREQVKTTTVKDEGIRPIAMQGWFMRMDDLEIADLKKLDCANCGSAWACFLRCPSLVELASPSSFHPTDLSDFLYCCEKLEKLDSGTWDLSRCERLSWALTRCRSLTGIPGVETWDTSSVRDMPGLFCGCENVESIDVSHFDTSSVADFESMFRQCSSLSEIDASRFETSKARNMSSMFQGCSSLARLDASSFTTDNVKTMNSMFAGCSSLSGLDLSSFDTKNVEDMQLMFYGCTSLENLDLTLFNADSLQTASRMFDYCERLSEVKLGSGFRWIGDDGFLPTPQTKFVDGATGNWARLEDGAVFAPSEIPDNAAGTYRAQVDGGIISTTLSGTPVVGQTLTCAASCTAADTRLAYQWQRGKDSRWYDISRANEAAYRLKDDDYSYAVRCRVSPADRWVSADAVFAEASASVEANAYYGVTATAPETAAAGSAVGVSVAGLPDASLYGQSETYVDWMRSGGGVVKSGKDIAFSKNPSVSTSKWYGFMGHTDVYPGQSYTLRYEGLAQTQGDQDCELLLFSWTTSPMSAVIKKLGTVAYGSGSASFTVPADLDPKGSYTVALTAGSWGRNDQEWAGSIASYTLTCEGDGLVTFLRNSATYTPTDADRGKKLAARVRFYNPCINIIELVCGPITIA